MGGGGAMRAATKVAGFGVNGSFRGASSVPLPAQSVATTARKASRPVAPAIVSSSSIEDVKSSVSIASHNNKNGVSSSVQRHSWEIDDWEFAGDEEKFLLDSMNPMPRAVFGTVPTLEEAKEATLDLKEALEKEYFFSSNAIGCKKSSTIVQEITQSQPLMPGHSETKACVTSESAVVHPSVPKPIFHAFSMLKESPEAQGVVASLACDKNVWEAVLQNEKVMEFIKVHQNSVPSSNMDIDEKQSSPYNESDNNQKLWESLDEEGDGKYAEGSGNRFRDFIQKVKITVADMVSNLSGFFQNMFGFPAEGNINIDGNGNATATNLDKSIGASFMALAVLAIMVVVLKRG